MPAERITSRHGATQGTRRAGRAGWRRTVTVTAAAAAAVLALCLAVGPAPAEVVAQAPGAVLRGLDKIAGASVDLELRTGETASMGPLAITLAECRYPAGDPASEAFAWVTIRDTRRENVLFDGWMIASSPALNALDHARYDFWVLSCKTS